MRLHVTLSIGIDCDNVLQEFSPIWNKYVISRGLREEGSLSPASTWNFFLDQGFTYDEFVSLCHEGVDDGVIFYDAPPMEGSVQALQRLKELGCTIHIITDRHFGSDPSASQHITERWLKEHNLVYDQIHFSGDKTVVKTDFMCDDLIKNYDALEKSGCTPYLYTWPWNIDDGSRRRVSNLNEFVDIVERTINEST